MLNINYLSYSHWDYLIGFKKVKRRHCAAIERERERDRKDRREPQQQQQQAQVGTADAASASVAALLLVNEEQRRRRTVRNCILFYLLRLLLCVLPLLLVVDVHVCFRFSLYVFFFSTLCCCCSQLCLLSFVSSICVLFLSFATESHRICCCLLCFAFFFFRLSIFLTWFGNFRIFLWLFIFLLHSFFSRHFLDLHWIAHTPEKNK